jgi:hypothetical protein
VSSLENCCGLIDVSCCCEKLVAEAGDSSRTQRKQRNNGSEDVTVDTSVYVLRCTVKCSHALYQSVQ